MKIFFAIVTSIILALQVYAEKTNSQINSIVVYQRGAKITRVASVKVTKGNNPVILTQLSENIDPNSIQVQVKGNATLLSATHHLNYLDDPKKTAAKKVLLDSIQLLENKIKHLGYQLELLDKEASILQNNIKLGSENEGVNVSQLSDLVIYQRNTNKQIIEKRYSTEIELDQLKKILHRLKIALGEIPAKITVPVNEIHLQLLAVSTENIVITFSYLTYNAGWVPLYDIQSGENTNTVNIKYKAKVYQQTGGDWENVSMHISTGNPTLNHNRPILTPWYLNISKGIKYRNTTSAPSTIQSTPSQEKKAILNSMLYETVDESDAIAPVYEVNEVTSQVATEYQIALLQNIPDGSQDNIVELINKQSEAIFKFHTVPKLNQQAYLIASIGNYGALNFLPGQANIFYNNNYIGQTYLNSGITSDTLVVSFGIDNKINIAYNALTDFTKRKKIGNTQRLTKAYEIVIKNNKTDAIIIDILDQLPVSGNSDIEVNADELSGATLVPEIGKLSWLKTIAPGASETIRLMYTIKYTAGANIIGL